MPKSKKATNETGDQALVQSERPGPDQEIPLFTNEDLPPVNAGWELYRKTKLTTALRIDGPFRVETSESENEPFLCEDGYLAIDARGYPYAIAADEFEQIYEPVVSAARSDKLDVPGNYGKEDLRDTVRVAGRCVACGGYADNDTDLLCKMCEGQGIDGEKMLKLKAGQLPGYITSAHGVGVDDLPFDGRHYTLPDGSKAPPHEVEQALQNWRENQVGLVEGGSIT